MEKENMVSSVEGTFAQCAGVCYTAPFCVAWFRWAVRASRHRTHYIILSHVENAQVVALTAAKGLECSPHATDNLI